MQSSLSQEDKEIADDKGAEPERTLLGRMDSETRRWSMMHGETWHGGQSYKKLQFESGGKWMETEDTSAQVNRRTLEVGRPGTLASKALSGSSGSMDLCLCCWFWCRDFLHICHPVAIVDFDFSSGEY